MLNQNIKCGYIKQFRQGRVVMSRETCLKLSELSTGSFVRVVEIYAKGARRRRLMDLGFINGTKVEVVRRSLSGDPTAYHIRGATIALRKEEADLVGVRVI